MIPDSSTILPARYWQFMIEMKAHAVYASEYHLASEKTDRRLSYYLAFASSSSIATWAVWQKWPMLWGSVIAVAQLIGALRSQLPYQKRISPLRNLSYAYEDLFLRVESKWHTIESGDLTEDEISELLVRFREEKAKAWRTTINELPVPHDDTLYHKSDQLAEDYFRIHYHV